MQNILGEALSNYEQSKVQWCYNYMREMRSIVLKKFDAICAHTLEYIENHTRYTAEELEKLANKGPGGRKSDSNIRPEFQLNNISPDIYLGIFGNVGGKSTNQYKPVEFAHISCRTPRQYANSQFIMRAIWTSYDDITV